MLVPVCLTLIVFSLYGFVFTLFFHWMGAMVWLIMVVKTLLLLV